MGGDAVKRKLILLAITCFILLLGISLWYWIRIQQNREREMELRSKAMYATSMDFRYGDSLISWGNVIAEFESNRHNPDEVQYTEIVFVHSPEEAVGFGEYVLVAWPSENFYLTPDSRWPIGTQARIDDLNYAILHSYPYVDLRDFGLPENEITINDVVENWEIVHEIHMLHWRYFQLVIHEKEE